MLILAEEKCRLVPSVPRGDAGLDGLAEIVEPSGNALIIRPRAKTVADALEPFGQKLGGDAERPAQSDYPRSEVAQQLVQRGKDDADSSLFGEEFWVKVYPVKDLAGLRRTSWRRAFLGQRNAGIGSLGGRALLTGAVRCLPYRDRKSGRVSMPILNRIGRILEWLIRV